MTTMIPMLLFVSAVATGFASQGAAQKTNQPEKPVASSRIPLDVSLQGLGGPSTIGLTTTTSCLDSIQDRGSGGNCLMASSTPTFGLLYPLGPEFNIDPAGNVGIGTTTPQTKLQVDGTVRIDPAVDNALDIATGSIYKGGTLFLHNKGGIRNTALGRQALANITSGGGNTASGSRALYNNTTGVGNTASGYRALPNNTIGSSNIAIGTLAGFNLTTGSSNIAIGNLGFAGESNTVRIGSGQTRTFIAGIRGVTTGAANAIAVMIDSNGQLGTVSSSRRFKEDIRSMDNTASRLLELRPVVFRYKPEVQSGERPLEYGLIAEEVAEIFPELVVYDEDGRPETVKYHVLNSMLLNELQKHASEKDAEIAGLRSRQADMENQLAVLTRRLEGQTGSR